MGVHQGVVGVVWGVVGVSLVQGDGGQRVLVWGLGGEAVVWWEGVMGAGGVVRWMCGGVVVGCRCSMGCVVCSVVVRCCRGMVGSVVVACSSGVVGGVVVWCCSGVWCVRWWTTVVNDMR